MSSAEYLREFVSKQLTAAAEEIIRVFQMTLINYEEEIGRQRRLLDIVFQPEIKLHRIELSQPRVCMEEIVTDQEGSTRLGQEDSEPLQIKEEQEAPSEKEGDQLVVKQESDTFMSTPFSEENDNSEIDSQNDHPFFSHSPHVIDSKNQGKDQHGESDGLTGSARPKRSNRQLSQYLSDPDSPESPSHTDKMSHTCKTCGKMFQYRSKLQRHLRVHTGEKPYLCKICQQRLCSESALKTHFRIHTGEKPYLCKSCGKRFRSMPPLKLHQRIHTGEKPFTCKICGRGFCRKSDLKPHIRIHTGEKPYSCNVCGRDFRVNSVLKVHMRTHTGEKPYVCTACGSGFSCRSGLLFHMRRSHSGKLQ